MTIDGRIKNKKVWYVYNDNNREAVNLSLLSGKIKEYQYLIYGEIFLPDQK